MNLQRHSGARAISAFTRVFDALWPAIPESMHTGVVDSSRVWWLWIPGPALRAVPE